MDQLINLPDDEEEDAGEEGSSEDAAPPPPMFATEAVLSGHGMSFWRDKRLTRKSMALKPMWWASPQEADLESQPVVPLIPLGSVDASAPPRPLI